MSGERKGVTLVELLVAIAISGLVLGAAGASARSVVDASARVKGELWATEDARLADDLLRELLWMHVGPNAARPLTGSNNQLQFESRCPVLGAGTWPCSVTLRISAMGEVSLGWTDAESIRLRGSGSARRLVYLDHIAQAPAWQDAWNVSTRLPLAVGIVSNRDTSIYWVGAR